MLIAGWSEARMSSNKATVIGSGAVIEGSIRAQGSVRVEGVVNGVLIVEGDAAIAPGGEVIGDVLADDLSICGRLDGNTSVRDHLHVASTGSLYGDARYGTLQVDRGGVLVGRPMPGEDKISIEVDAFDANVVPEPA
jgi:cytoskeletal protein CcmA (bactofilin family)